MFLLAFSCVHSFLFFFFCVAIHVRAFCALFRACELHTPALFADVDSVFLVIPNCSVTAWSGVINGL